MVYIEYLYDLQELEPGSSIIYYYSLLHRYKKQLESGKTYKLV